MHERLEIAQDRANELTQRVEEKGSELEARERQLETKNLELKTLPEEIAAERSKTMELAEQLAQNEEERTAATASAEHWLACDTQLY